MRKPIPLRGGFVIIGALGGLGLAVTAAAGPAPTGACCFVDEFGVTQCDILTADECAALVPPGVYQGDDTSCGLCALAECAQERSHCQLANIPKFPGGVILSAATTRDNFVPTVTGEITDICFWGAYINTNNNTDCGPGPGDRVTVTYYENVEGFPPTPGAVLAGPFDVSATVTAADTGLDFVLVGFDAPVDEYVYTATHDPVPVVAGTCYWIEITNEIFPWDCGGDDDGNAGIVDFLALLSQWGEMGTSCDLGLGDPGVGINEFLDLLSHWGPQRCFWFWEVSPEGADALSVDADNDENPFDMAWCIDQPLGDAFVTCPPVNEGCVGATNSCLETSLEPGCDNAECCSLVCEFLPFCCTNAWDQQCVDGAAFGCAPEFETDTLVSADGMWTATIDAIGQISNVFPPDQPDSDNVFETIVYDASTAGGGVSRRVEDNYSLTAAEILDGGARSFARLEKGDAPLAVEIENTMVDGVDGGVLVTLRIENIGPDPTDCKLFYYCDLDISADFGDDEAVTVPDPPDPQLIAIEQIDNEGKAGPKPLWVGGCPPYKSWEIDTFANLRTALDGGVAQLTGADATKPGSADHTLALSSQTVTLQAGEILEMNVAIGAPSFAGCP